MMEQKFLPGEKALMIVGLPGPDVEVCEVLTVNEDGTCQVRFKVHGQGVWHECVGYPGQRAISGIFKIKKDHTNDQ